MSKKDKGTKILSIGSEDSNHIQLNSRYVNEKHARLIVSKDGVTIEDLNSTFHTFVNNQKVNGSRTLKSGDRIKLGASPLNWEGYCHINEMNADEASLYIKDLFSPFGTIRLSEFKYIILLFISGIIIFSIGIPVSLGILEIMIDVKHQPVGTSVELVHYTYAVMSLIGLVLFYVFLNLTQKFIRGRLK